MLRFCQPSPVMEPRFFRLLPFGWAHFTWVRGNVLRRFDFAHQVVCITAYAFGGDFNSLDDALWVDDEGGTVGQILDLRALRQSCW